MKINYNNRKFRPVTNSESGDAGADTVFHYHQDGPVVWAEYSGGQVIRGQLMATCAENGILDMRYQHVNAAGELMTGICRSAPDVLPDGRLRLREKWQWTSGDRSDGESVIEEIIEQAPL
jgi:hypothetical protein